MMKGRNSREMIQGNNGDVKKAYRRYTAAGSFCMFVLPKKFEDVFLKEREMGRLTPDLLRHDHSPFSLHFVFVLIYF